MNFNCASEFSKKAILLYGPRKSGSSLLHNLLDGGNDLLMLPSEIKVKKLVRSRKPKDLVRHYVSKGRLDFRSMIRKAQSGLQLNPDFHFEGLSIEKTRELFDLEGYVAKLQKLTENGPQSYGEVVRYDVEAFAQSLRRATEYSCWAGKEVAGPSQEVTRFFSQHFPAAKFLFICRDPRFVVRSIILDRRRENRLLGVRSVWKECREVQRMNRFVFDRALLDESSKSVFLLSYEKLTRDTNGVMEEVCRFLELPFDSVYTTPTTLGIPVIVRTSSQATATVFQPERDWRKDLTKKQVLTMQLFFGQNRTPYRFKNSNYSYEQMLKNCGQD